jgi:Uma2 family endonuclease
METAAERRAAAPPDPAPAEATDAAPASDYERERGKPMPSKNHSAAQRNLLFALAPYRTQFSVMPELTLDLDDGGPVTPDLSIYPPLEIDFTDDEIRVTEPPLVAVAISTPMEPANDLVQKAKRLLAAGVQSVWIVMTPVQTITVFTGVPGDLAQTTYRVGETLTDPATGIEVALADVFDPSA